MPNKEVNLKQTFEALPNVNEIWLTDDGHFHLHPHNGGKKVERDSVIKPDAKQGKDAKPKE